MGFFKKKAKSYAEHALMQRAKEKGVKASMSKGDDYDPYAVRDVKGERERAERTKAAYEANKDMPEPSPERFGGAPQAPYVVQPEHKSMIEKIFGNAREERTPSYPPATEPIFGPADPKLTKELVPQRSIASQLPPKPTLDARLPANERARPILEHENLIGSQLAKNMKESPWADDPLNFYSTGSIIQGMVDKGDVSLDEARNFMRKWAGQGAATSPRTATPTNLKNAAYLLFRNASGDRLTSARQKAERDAAEHGFPSTHNLPNKKGEAPGPLLNRPGFPMMGMHTDLGDQFLQDTVDPWRNPKPFTFRENWSGNMADVTADTHNIRAVLDAYESLDPGGLPRGWFKTDEGYQKYLAGDVFPDEGQIDVGAIEDGLKSQMIGGRQAQTEYPIMQGPTIKAAEELNISPAEAQERLWFDRGSRTGLQSPRSTIPDLFNSQIEKTARLLGISQEEVLKLFLQSKIPLAANEEDRNMPGASAAA